MDRFIRPRRLFLDTNHLVNMAHLREGRALRGGQDERRVAAYRTLDEWIMTGKCIPLFYEPMSYEWIRQGSADGAYRIAAVLDSAVAILRVLPDPLIFVVEALNEAQRIEPRLGFPCFDVVRALAIDGDLVQWFNEYWPHEDEKAIVHGRLGARGEHLSVVAFVGALARLVRTGNDLWQVALDGERHALDLTRQTQKEHGSSGALPEVVRRHWLKSALSLDKVIRRLAPGLDADDLLGRIDLGACPALQLKLDAYWNYAKATEKPKSGDLIDISMFAALPYVDVALIENRMHEFVLQARRSGYGQRVHRDPAALVEFVMSQDGQEVQRGTLR